MVENSANEWRRILRRRLGVAAGAFLLWSAGIEARLVYLQVVRHADLSARAERQQSRTIEAPAKRGEILDRGGRVLAYSVDADTVYAVPTEIEDADRAAGALCGALADCSVKDRQALAERIRKGKHFVYVRRQVSPEQARRVAALQLEGIGFIKENRRFYPNRDLASHVLGYVGIDNTGLGGIEATYDSLIKGKAGTILVQTDARRHAFSRVERPPTAGATLELTIDQYLQHIVERELRAGVLENRAAAGSAVVLNPATGEILALASWPTYNPNAYGDARDEQRRNRSVQDLYEPGSIFKVVTASAALEQHLIRPTDLIDTNGGHIRLGRRVISDTHNYGTLPFTDAIVKSSNVAAIKVGLRLGPDRLSSYINRFGFGRPLSPDFPGESPGIVWNPAKLNDSALASVSMGYQVGVTPLQMAAAVSAVANGGELVQPRVVRAVVRDGHRAVVPRKVLQRAIEQSVASEMMTIMELVVEEGTGRPARLEAFTVAGKTGTAKKVVNGSYRGHNEYNASFVGFVPSRKPVFTIVVAIDSPHGKNGYYGGPVSGPVFRRIADAALRLYGVPPSLNAPPPVLVARHEEVREQPASTPIAKPDVVTVDEASPINPGSVFPDLTGMSARDALRVLSRLGFTARLQGAGVVIDQQPAAGTPLDSANTVTLRLGRQPAVQVASAAKP